jgi:uncharacterized membrane protein
MTQPRKTRPRLIDRLWVQLLVSLWVLAIIVIYFRHRIFEVMQLAGIGTGP